MSPLTLRVGELLTVPSLVLAQPEPSAMGAPAAATGLAAR